MNVRQISGNLMPRLDMFVWLDAEYDSAPNIAGIHIPRPIRTAQEPGKSK